MKKVIFASVFFAFSGVSFHAMAEAPGVSFVTTVFPRLLNGVYGEKIIVAEQQTELNPDQVRAVNKKKTAPALSNVMREIAAHRAIATSS